MRSRRLTAVAGGAFLWTALCSWAWAGQVITDQDRQWAREALDREKALSLVSGLNTIAVLNFRNTTGQARLDALQKGLALMLITDLARTESLQVVERVRMQALVQEMGLGQSGLVEPGTAPRAGRLLGARWLVGGAINGTGLEFLRVPGDLLEVTPERMLGHPSAEGRIEEVFRMEKDLLFEILRLLNVKISKEKEEEVRRPFSISVQVFLRYLEGIEASDRGEYGLAAGMYEDALRQDPGFSAADDALKELKALGLVTETKRSGSLLRSLRQRTSHTDQLSPDYVIKRERTPKDVDQVISPQPGPLPEPPPPPTERP